MNGLPGIVAAAREHRALHRREDRALVGAGAGLRDRGIERRIGELGRAPDAGDLGRPT